MKEEDKYLDKEVLPPLPLFQEVHLCSGRFRGGGVTVLMMLQAQLSYACVTC